MAAFLFNSYQTRRVYQNLYIRKLLKTIDKKIPIYYNVFRTRAKTRKEVFMIYEFEKVVDHIRIDDDHEEDITEKVYVETTDDEQCEVLAAFVAEDFFRDGNKETVRNLKKFIKFAGIQETLEDLYYDDLYDYFREQNKHKLV